MSDRGRERKRWAGAHDINSPNSPNRLLRHQRHAQQADRAPARGIPADGIHEGRIGYFSIHLYTCVFVLLNHQGRTIDQILSIYPSIYLDDSYLQLSISFNYLFRSISIVCMYLSPSFPLLVPPSPGQHPQCVFRTG